MRDIERLAARMVGIGFGGTELCAEARALIGRGVGSAIFFARNVESPAQFASLVADVKDAGGARPVMTCIDQEGGRVMRLGEPFTRVPSMRQVGRGGDPALAREIGRILGRELRAVNIDVDLAPVLDVDTDPGNPVISVRSFGADAELVARLGVEVIRGIQEQGVGACGKHFPGHGDTRQDSHVDLPSLPHGIERLNAVELRPFVAAIAAGVASIMTAHVIYSAIDAHPATLSAAILDDILRKRLGFDGVVMSDDMQMKALADHYPFDDAIVRAARAGVDLFWICHSLELQNRAIEVLAKAVTDGALPRATIESAGHRLDVLSARYVKPPLRGALPTFIGCPAHQAVADEIRHRAGDVAAGEDPTERFVRQQRT